MATNGFETSTRRDRAAVQPRRRCLERLGSAVLVTAVSVLVLALIGIVIWQIFKTAQTRMTTQTIIAQDEQFRRLAERAAESQATIAVETARISAELQEISVRIAAMERMLRDVG